MPIPGHTIDRFVQEEGERVRHLIGLRCFCHGPDGQPDPNCTAHELGGWLYPEENEIVGLVTGVAQHREWVEAGVTMPGDCVFSPLSQATVSEGDKIIFTWPLPYGQGDPLIRGIAAGDTLYYPASRAIYCIDENREKYREAVDFIIDGRKVIWQWDGKTGRSPATGARYTIKYMAFIEWIALDPPTNRISAGEDIGSKVLLRKKHILEG